MENVQLIYTDKIKLPPNNMREHIDRDTIFELADDIKKNGLISPITVRPLADGYELVAGQRRYLAHQFAGILQIKCVVRKLTDDQAFAIMTSENLARVDVNPVDEAKHIGRLLEYNHGDIAKVSDIVGRSIGWVKDRIAVSQMPDYMQEFLGAKQLKLGVALILIQIEHEPMRQMWTEQAVRDGVNIAMAEYWLSDYKRQLLPGGSLAGVPEEGFVPEAPQTIMFTCAVDGQQYDCRLFKTVTIYEPNLDVFNTFVSAFRKAQLETESGGGDE